MINHIVLFKLKDYPLKGKAEIRDELTSLLKGLKEKVPGIEFLKVGQNYLLEAKSYDLALITHFESVENLDAYRIHPEHLKVVQRIREITQATAAVDFEF